LQADILCEWFPTCAVVHIVRDPRAVVRSMMNVPWATRSVWLGTRTWRLHHNAALRVSGRDNYFQLKYEDLTTQPQIEISRLCRHLGLPYEETMLSPNPAEAKLPSGASRSYQEITPATVDLWKEQLADWQIAAIEMMAAREMKAHGYVRQTVGAPVNVIRRAAIEVCSELALTWTRRAPGISSRAFRPTKLLQEEKLLARSYAIYKRRSSPRP
jgi:hypothetical protein